MIFFFICKICNKESEPWKTILWRTWANHRSLWTWQCREMPTCAVTRRAKWTNSYPLCVHVFVCICGLCAPLSKCVILYASVPVCISRKDSLVKARVSSSYGQLYAVWLSRQQIVKRRDAGSEERKRSMAYEGEVSGPQWSQYISVILSEVTVPLTYEWIARKVV